jgi:3-hydroxyacyl-CoA dehydrogenase
MKNVAVIGAGKIGANVAQLLASTGDYQVTLVDRSAEALAGRDLMSAFVPWRRMSRTARRWSICSTDDLP